MKVTRGPRSHSLTAKFNRGKAEKTQLSYIPWDVRQLRSLTHTRHSYSTASFEKQESLSYLFKNDDDGVVNVRVPTRHLQV